MLPVFLVCCFISGSKMGLAAVSPGLTIVAGNGQVTPQYFNSSVPLTVEARDTRGNPIPNLPLTWTVTQGQGTIVAPPATTDANGMAGALFDGNVTPGLSFSQETVTVSSSVGSVNFLITTVINRLSNGSIAELPLVQLLSPPPESRTLTGKAGSTIHGAIAIQVVDQSGIQSGLPIPNVGVHVVNGDGSSGTPAAQCAGEPLTDANGNASCDLVLTGAPGVYSISADVGEFRIMPVIILTITAGGSSCTYSVSASSLQFAGNNGLGTLTVNTQSGCTWTVVSNSNWLTVTSGVNGSGTGGATFSVAPNTGAARSGSFSVAGQTITINQAGSGTGSGLTILTSALPTAATGTAYTASIAVTGGRAPYNWATTATLPAGLTLNSSTGVISGTPSNAGTYTLPVTVTDQGGLSQSQTFTLSVMPQGQPGSNPSIMNTAFPNATVGVAYQQALNSMGGCLSPFSAPPVYTVSSGALPAGLVITGDRSAEITGVPTVSGISNFTITVSDPCGRTGSSNFSITVTGGGGVTPGPVSGSPASLSFSVTPGATSSPADQTISINGPAGTAFSASTSTYSGGNWLTLSGLASGSFPGSVTIHVASTNALAAGTYSGAVNVASTAGSATVPVTLTVAAAAAALNVSPASIKAIGQMGGAAVQQTVAITNASGAPAHFTVSVSTVTGGAWLSVNSVSGDAPANLTVTMNPVGLQQTVYTGAIQLMPTNPAGTPVTIPVSFQVLGPAALAVSPGTLSFLSQPGQPPAAAQLLTIASTGPAVGATVSATTQSGGTWLFATPGQGNTPLSVSVSVNAAGLAAGTYQGTVAVTSAQGIAPVSIPVMLTIPQVNPVVTAIVNAASFQPTSVSPGEIVTLVGSGIGPASLVASLVTAAGVLDSTLSETRVYFDENPAPLIYAWDKQVSAIVPYQLTGRVSTRVQVEYRGVRSPEITLGVVPGAPGVFTYPAGGQGQAAAFNEDGTLNSPTNGAAPGSIVVLYATGEGQTNPGGVNGKLATDAVVPKPMLTIRVQFNGEYADVLYAGGAPTLTAGLLQVNARLPADLPAASTISVVVRAGDAPSQAGVVIYTK